MSPAAPNRARVRAAALAVVAGLLGTRTARAEDPPADAWVELSGPAVVQGLRVTDLDGDGVDDVLAVSARDVLAWRGVRDGRPAPAPTWRFEVPAAATFVAPDRPAPPAAPALLALAGAQVLRLRAGERPTVVEGLEVSLPWTDPARAVLSDFRRGDGILLPRADGFHWVPDLRKGAATGVHLRVPPARRLTSPGPFVEDGAVVETTWTSPTVLPAGVGAAGGGVVALGEDGLRAFFRTEGALREVGVSTATLPREGTVRDALVDLDGDGLPDLVREGTTNDSGVYAFFTWDPTRDAPKLRPRSVVRLTGFQIPSDYTDLDGDGRLDFVVTTIDIDAGNIRRAVLQGRVTARTRAFLNRSRAGAELFAGVPDAEVESDIRVRILFTFSGSIEVQRSFTIVPTADLDGDGRKDLAIRAPDGSLRVHRGREAGVWDPEPVTVELPPVGKSPDVEGYVGELTGDRKQDLVLLYRAPPGGTDRLVVRPSR